ncbi:MAG TPA: PadR family transcriptional regulator [Acidimicrobiales bacterium]|nr:PadR family transcriptional regulator [Acidimicrobiales bacterium]
MTTPASPLLRRPNDPPLLLLTSLASGPKHGYALLKDVEGFAGVTLSPGTLYGALTRLEEQGLIEPVASEERRRPYRITASGVVALREVTNEMRRLSKVSTSRLRLVGGVA